MKNILILLVSMPLLVSCTIGKTPVTTEGTKDTVNASSQNAVMEGSITTPEKMIRDESQIPLMNLKTTTPPLNPLEIK
ncbi:MAG: hypothetical protein PHU93_02640 [Candidatus Gracilibacteria bacterium]|nr:hypothetical protein [Candidatus Gracilibacteria bacterium]